MLGSVGWVAAIANVCAVEHVAVLPPAGKQGLRGGSRLFLPLAAAVFVVRAQRQVHAIGQGGLPACRPRRRPAAAAAVAAEPRTSWTRSRAALEQLKPEKLNRE